MTQQTDYETTLPKVFYALDELERDHDQVQVPLAAFEWMCDHLERAGWTIERIKAHVELYFDPNPLGVSG